MYWLDACYVGFVSLVSFCLLFRAVVWLDFAFGVDWWCLLFAFGCFIFILAGGLFVLCLSLWLLVIGLLD